MKLYSRESYENIRTGELSDKGEKNCPFCDEEKQSEYTIWKGKYWKICHNKFPFAGSKKHLLAVPRRCERYTRELSAEEWADFRNVEIFMKDFYKDTKYYSFIREEGEVKSIHHLHYHFLPGEMMSPPLIQMMREQGLEEQLEE